MNIEEQLDFLLSHESENEILEFKEANNGYDFDKIGKYFSALSNEANLANKKDAWLVFGVKDSNKKLINTRFRLDSIKLQSLKAEIANHTTNRITFVDIHEVLRGEGRVLLFQIPAAPRGIPIAFKGHYYGRDGEELNALNLEEIERIRSQATLEDWSIGVCSEATIDDLSDEAIAKARLSFVTKNPGLTDAISTWDDSTFLNKAKLTINGKITKTAILLLGKPESEHYLTPAVAKISWILKDRDNISKDYEHFSCPFILHADEVYGKIRNLKYRYMTDGSLFPEEVDSYDPYIIREALNNCIAHQDYTLGGKINVIESEDSKLIFVNSGSFIPQSVENVITADAPESTYRNRFLAQAMVNLNMIDTIGSGIVKMFNIQKRKYFPLPDYEFSNEEVKVVIEGKVLDMNYARKLVQMPELTLREIMLLDKVQKTKTLTSEELKELKSKKLVEGKRPNLHISSKVAKQTGQKDDYMKLRGIDDDYCKKIIVDYLKRFGTGKRADFEAVILDKLSDTLDIDQKKNKVRNNLQTLRKDGIIENIGNTWKMSKVI